MWCVRFVHWRAFIVGRIGGLGKRRDRCPCVVLLIVAFLPPIVVRTMSFFVAALGHEPIVFLGPSERLLSRVLLFHVFIKVRALYRLRRSRVAVVVNLEWTCLRQPSHVAVVECVGLLGNDSGWYFFKMVVYKYRSMDIMNIKVNIEHKMNHGLHF